MNEIEYLKEYLFMVDIHPPDSCSSEFETFVSDTYEAGFSPVLKHDINLTAMLTTFIREFSYMWGSKLRIKFLEHEGFGHILQFFYNNNDWTITTTRLTSSGNGSHVIQYNKCNMVDHTSFFCHDSNGVAEFCIEFEVRGGFEVIDLINNIDDIL